jgi:hypothetical protein
MKVRISKVHNDYAMYANKYNDKCTITLIKCLILQLHVINAKV